MVIEFCDSAYKKSSVLQSSKIPRAQQALYNKPVKYQSISVLINEDFAKRNSFSGVSGLLRLLKVHSTHPVTQELRLEFIRN